MLNLFCTSVCVCVGLPRRLFGREPSVFFTMRFSGAPSCRCCRPAESVQRGAGRGDSCQDGSDSGREGERVTQTELWSVIEKVTVLRQRTLMVPLEKVNH